MSTSAVALASEKSPASFELLGQKVDALTLERARDALKAAVDDRRMTYFAFCTVSSVLASRDDPQVRAALSEAGFVSPDGMPLVWAGRRAGCVTDRVYGPDFMLDAFAHLPGLSHFFYGGAPGMAEEMVKRLRARFPDLKVAGVLAPGAVSGSEVEARDVEVINASGADVVWVGLGHPKQELWMRTHRGYLEPPVLAGVGAAFDFLSGRKKEAPDWVRRSGLQWLHRLASDPRRLWRRYLVGNTRFLILLARERFG